MALFSLSLKHEQSGLDGKYLSVGLPHDASKQVLAKLARSHILHCLLLMRTKRDKSLKVAQAQYKNHFYALV